MKADKDEDVLFGEETDLPFIAKLKSRSGEASGENQATKETGKREKHTVHVRSHAGARGAFGVCIRSETGKVTLGQSFRDNSPFTWELAGIAAGLEHVPGEGQEVELTVTAQYMASRVRDFLEGGPIRGGNEELWERVRKAAGKHQVQVKHTRFPVLEEETVTAAGAALIASLRQEDGFLRIIRTGRKSP